MNAKKQKKIEEEYTSNLFWYADRVDEVLCRKRNPTIRAGLALILDGLNIIEGEIRRKVR